MPCDANPGADARHEVNEPGSSSLLIETVLYLRTRRQSDEKPPNLAQTLSFLSPNLGQTLSFLRSKKNKETKNGKGLGGQRPPDIVPGTASRAAGALGGPSPSCGLRFL